MKGIVKCYLPERGFGFITDTTGHDHFFHIRKVIGNLLLYPGDEVSFNLKMNEQIGKDQAIDVTITKEFTKQVYK